MAMIKKTDNNKYYLTKMWSNWNFHVLQNGTGTLENSLAIPQKLNHSYLLLYLEFHSQVYTQEKRRYNI